MNEEKGKISDSEIEKEFQNAGIYPEIISKPPSEFLEIFYKIKCDSNEDNFVPRLLNPGDKIDKNVTKHEPNVNWIPVPGDQEKNFTLIMMDPDAISRRHHIFRSWLHWLVVNIKFSPEMNKLDISTGKTLANYTKSFPPIGTGIHRYVFLLYEQKNLENRRPYKIKANFDINKFSQKRGLILKAGNFFLCQN